MLAQVCVLPIILNWLLPRFVISMYGSQTHTVVFNNNQSNTRQMLIMDYVLFMFVKMKHLKLRH